jgi:glycosyltransferase involved in cell wall biosynthesis
MHMSGASASVEKEPVADPDVAGPAVAPRLRVLYAIGPGDVVKMYRELVAGSESALQMHKDFSKLFLDWCAESGAEAHLISWHPNRDLLRDGLFTLENRPKPGLSFRGGLLYHLGELMYALSLMTTAIRMRARVVIVDSGSTDWIFLSLLPLVGIRVIAVMHNSLWAAGFPPRRLLHRLWSASDGFFFRHVAAATVNVSPECERQVVAVARKPKGPVYQCRAQYRKGFLDGVAPPPAHGVRPFRVMYLGRVEEFKGVLMIPEIAAKLEREFPGQFAWKIVGGGRALERLRAKVAALGLTNVEVTARLPNADVMEALGWAHAMVAPTTSGFQEGLAMTVAEGVLAGRPGVVSSVVPAWEVLGGAAIVAQAENVDSFVDAFRRLLLEPEHYEACRRATAEVQGQFYDAFQGLGAVLGRAIAETEPKRRG